MEIKLTQKYIKAGDNIHHGDIVFLTNEGVYKEVEIKGEKKTILEFKLKLPNKEIKDYSMHGTTQKNLVRAFGKESKEWINKPLKTWIMPQMSFGKMIDVLILSPQDWKSPIDEAKEDELETIQLQDDANQPPEDLDF